jgi:curli biogenesis system outer membrane secretion channel CsgG
MRLFRKILFVTLLFSLTPAVADIKYVQTETQGTGVTLSEAINNALLEAISQINGKSLKGQSILQSAELSVTDGESSAYLASEAYGKRIEEQTQGSVKDYRLVDKTETDSGWFVKVTARIAKFERSASAARKSIAIVPLRFSQSGYTILGNWVRTDRIAKRLDQELTNYLTQTRKFAILDRRYVQETAGEKQIIEDGKTPAEDMARLGQQLAADFVFVGTLQGLGYENITNKSRASDRTYQTGFGRAELAFRVIDVATQQIAVSDTMTVSTDKAAGSTQAALLGLIRPLSRKISDRIHEQIYPVLVVNVVGEQLVLGQGGDTLVAGEQYEIFKYGEKTFDPYTDEFLGWTEEPVGIVEIDRVTPKQAYADVERSTEDIARNFEVRKYVIRGKVSQPVASSKVEVRKLKKRTREDLGNDDDW